MQKTDFFCKELESLPCVNELVLNMPAVLNAVIVMKNMLYTAKKKKNFVMYGNLQGNPLIVFLRVKKFTYCSSDKRYK